MKFLGTLLLMISLNAWPDSLVLEEFDQVKLGELLSRIPDDLAPKTVTEIPGDMPASETHISFPAQPQGFQIICKRTFYNGSPYPSFTTCLVTIDSNHPATDKGYDEIRFRIVDVSQVQGLFAAIPYGIPLKEFYSWERDAGTNYEGSPADVFHYRFECSLENCLIRFSGISMTL